MSEEEEWGCLFALRQMSVCCKSQLESCGGVELGGKGDKPRNCTRVLSVSGGLLGFPCGGCLGVTTSHGMHAIGARFQRRSVLIYDAIGIQNCLKVHILL